METSRVNNYLTLIQKLLSCPYGEEWIHLKHHEDWVDAGFVQVMEQIAMQLMRQGDRTAATFLHNWAAKLHHILLKEIDPSDTNTADAESHLDLIQQLLACPEGTEEQVLTAHETLIGPGLVQKMREVVRQLKRQGKREQAQYLDDVASDLSQSWLQAQNFQPQMNKASASQKMTPAHAPSTQPSSSHSQRDQPSKRPTINASFDDDEDELWFSTDDILKSESKEMATSNSPAMPPVTSPATSLSNGNGTQPAIPKASPSSPQIEPSQARAIAAGLIAIAQALQQLNHTLKARTQNNANPLQHLELLEKASEAKWQLTTEEIEKLIGVRPKCHGSEKVYQRGEWYFTKTGKHGKQIAWQVTKAEE